MLGVGRFGGIAGSFLVAELSRQQMGFSDVFTVVSLAAVVSTMALLIKQAADRGNPDGGKPVLARGAAAAAEQPDRPRHSRQQALMLSDDGVSIKAGRGGTQRTDEIDEHRGALRRSFSAAYTAFSGERPATNRSAPRAVRRCAVAPRYRPRRQVGDAEACMTALRMPSRLFRRRRPAHAPRRP
jgi:hypothetical protein